MKKNVMLLFMLYLVNFLVACSTTTAEPSEAYKNETPRQVYQKGVVALRDNNYSEAIKRFEALDVQYPFGAETERAQLYLIYAYYMNEDYALAVAAADRYIRMHPTNNDVDYAFYMKGVGNYYQNLGPLERLFPIDLAKRDLTQIKKSYLDFSTLTMRFPNSCYAPSAHQYLIYLRNILANHDLQIGQYYYNRKAYVAAANRASNVVAHFQGSPAVLDALGLMAKSYHQLGLKKLEQDTITVLKYNYPDINIVYDS